MSKQDDKLVFRFTHEAAAATQKVTQVTRQDLEGVDTVKIQFFNGTQTREGVKAFAEQYGENAKVIVEDPTQGEIVEAAREYNVEIFPLNHLPKMYASWTCSAI